LSRESKNRSLAAASNPASKPTNGIKIMPKIEVRFDLAAILLASVLTMLGMSAAGAGGMPGGVLGDAKKSASSEQQRAGGSPGGVLGDRSASGGQQRAAGARESDAVVAGGRVGGGGDV
jgi:hypothetical protein